MTIADTPDFSGRVSLETSAPIDVTVTGDVDLAPGSTVDINAAGNVEVGSPQAGSSLVIRTGSVSNCALATETVGGVYTIIPAVSGKKIELHGLQIFNFSAGVMSIAVLPSDFSSTLADLDLAAASGFTFDYSGLLFLASVGVEFNFSPNGNMSIIATYNVIT